VNVPAPPDPRERDAWLEAMGLVRWTKRSLPQDITADVTAGASAASTPVASVALAAATQGQSSPPPEQSPSQPAFDAVADPANMDWQALRACVAECQRCELHSTRTQTVFGVGNLTADWLVIGEAPGAEEDRRGEPFVGRAGQLLDAMLAAVGRSRESVFIANVLKCRPPNNRDPRADEADACRPYLARQIELLAPKLILAVGRIAAQQLLGVSTPIGKLRGRVHEAMGVQLVVTYHPAYLLRSPADKARAWEDLLLACRVSHGARA